MILNLEFHWLLSLSTAAAPKITLAEAGAELPCCRSVVFVSFADCPAVLCYPLTLQQRACLLVGCCSVRELVFWAPETYLSLQLHFFKVLILISFHLDVVLGNHIFVALKSCAFHVYF